MERCLAPAFPTWDKAQFWRLAERFSLSRKAKVKDLSRGMGMKLQLAVALSHKADLLVLDEATAGLDPICLLYTSHSTNTASTEPMPPSAAGIISASASATPASETRMYQ